MLIRIICTKCFRRFAHFCHLDLQAGQRKILAVVSLPSGVNCPNQVNQGLLDLRGQRPLRKPHGLRSRKKFVKTDHNVDRAKVTKSTGLFLAGLKIHITNHVVNLSLSFLLCCCCCCCCICLLTTVSPNCKEVTTEAATAR